MSVTDSNHEEIIRLPGFWEVMMKVALALSVPMFLLGISWTVWITNRSFEQERDIAVIQSKLSGISSQVGKLPGKVAETLRKPNPEE